MKLTEGELEFEFYGAVSAKKFDDEQHGLSYCMKAVDFIVETKDKVYYIEVKDPLNSHTKEESRKEFIERYESAKLDTDLYYKYRDSFLYNWASGNVKKKILYLILIEIGSLDPALLLNTTERLRKKLPVGKSRPSIWQKEIVSDCIVFNIKSWNRTFKEFPVRRITE